MENTSKASFYDETHPCYCWKCYVEAEFVQSFDTIQEYVCPKCSIRICIGDAEFFDPLRTKDDDSDSVSLCVCTSTSRRSTVTYSESEAGVSDVDNRPLTPENVDLLGNQTPLAATNTPADGDVPDAPPNIAKAFADVTNFLLNVPPKRRSQRLSFGGLSNMNGSDFLSPSKMIQSVIQAYERCSSDVDDSLSGPEGRMTDQPGQSIEIRITPSTDTSEFNSKVFTRKLSASEMRNENVEAGKELDFKKE